MRLARLLRGAASAAPGRGPRAARSSASRSLTSHSGSGPAPERGVPGQVDFYARFSPSPLSMKQFLDFGERGPGLGPLCAAPLASAHPFSSTRPPPPTPPHLLLPQRLSCFLLPSPANPYAQVQERVGRVYDWQRMPFYCVLLKNKPGGPRTERLPALQRTCRSPLAARPLPNSSACGGSSV